MDSSSKTPVQQPVRSGFDKSFRNLLTAPCGTLVPLLCDPVVAGTRVNLRSAMNVSMPPLASDAFMNVDYKVEAFFVPASALYGGFNQWVTQKGTWFGSPTYVDTAPDHSILPDLRPTASDLSSGAFAPGSLADYLGYKNLNVLPTDSDNVTPHLNIFPFLAYHRIYDRFYRNTLVSKPMFYNPYASYDSYMNATTLKDGLAISSLPYLNFSEQDMLVHPLSHVCCSNATYGDISATVLNDGSMLKLDLSGLETSGYGSLYGLHQRHFGPDYFTTATPWAQRVGPSVLNLVLPVTGTTAAGNIPVSAIRVANALQMFREKNNLIDDDIHSYNRAHYGVTKTGYGESLPVYLGSDSFPVYSNGVPQAANNASGSVSTQNPFASTGATYGNAVGNGHGNLIDSFEAPEYGYVFVMGSLVPRAAYSGGVRRHLVELANNPTPAIIPDAVLQGVGPQEVYQYELRADLLGAPSPSNPSAYLAIFGYQQRYAHYMDMLNEVHGNFRAGSSLSSFALQRIFSTNPQMVGTFLPIPPNFMDQVAAVTSQISTYGVMVDSFFDYRVSMPLAAYSIPTLENPAGSTEFVPRAGFKIA